MCTCTVEKRLNKFSLIQAISSDTCHKLHAVFAVAAAAPGGGGDGGRQP